MRSFVLVETRAVAESRHGSFCDSGCDWAAQDRMRGVLSRLPAALFSRAAQPGQAQNQFLSC
jgi:hypothetical protein